MTNVEKAKMIAELKRQIRNGEVKTSNKILTTLERIGVNIKKIDWSEYRDVKSANGKYAISRKTIEGKMIKLIVGNKNTEFFTKDKLAKLKLENFVLNLDAISDVKYMDRR